MRWMGPFALSFLLSLGCGDDDDDAAPDAAVDAAVDRDAEPPPADAGSDASADSGPEGCRLATPLVGGTVQTDALAQSPARCGMPAYVWRTGPDLGDVVTRAAREEHTAAELEAALAMAGMNAPVPLEHDVAVETVVYVTQDRGQATESSMVLAYPTDLPAGRELPVVLLLHGTSGFTRGCGATGGPEWRALAALFASLGWIAAGPDYLGLESEGDDYPAPHPYLVGEPTAMASLDAARAAAKAVAADGAVCASTRFAAAGGSQGGHAALWVDRLAPYYARELTLIGTVAWVPATDVVGHADRALRAAVPASANTAAILATQPPWYGYGDRLDEVFVPPYDTDLPAALEASCSPEVSVESLEELFQPDLLAAVTAGSIADVDPFGCTFVESSLLATSVERIGPDDPTYGILFVTGENDRLVVPEIERPAYDSLCAAGLPLQYLECAGAAHVDAVLWSIAEALAFLGDRRDGVPFTPACTRPAATHCLGEP